MSADRNYDHATWVEVDVLADGTYAVGIHYTADRSISLNPLQAFTYVANASRMIAVAEYGAAVLKQLVTIGVDDANAAPTVGEVMGDAWKGADLVRSIGVRMVPLIAQRDRRPYVRIDVDGQPLTQWAPVDAKDHAINVQMAAATVRLDTAYHQFLKGQLSLPEEKARGLVGDLAAHREETDDA